MNPESLTAAYLVGGVATLAISWLIRWYSETGEIEIQVNDLSPRFSQAEVGVMVSIVAFSMWPIVLPICLWSGWALLIGKVAHAHLGNDGVRLTLEDPEDED